MDLRSSSLAARMRLNSDTPRSIARGLKPTIRESLTRPSPPRGRPTAVSRSNLQGRCPTIGDADRTSSSPGRPRAIPIPPRDPPEVGVASDRSWPSRGEWSCNRPCRRGDRHSPRGPFRTKRAPHDPSKAIGRNSAAWTRPPESRSSFPTWSGRCSLPPERAAGISRFPRSRHPVLGSLSFRRSPECQEWLEPMGRPRRRWSMENVDRSTSK